MGRTVVFSAALAASALLLFCVEPMVAKMVLPRFGGAASTWNTCQVFFQMALLVGYGWAHGVSRLRPRLQPLAHAALLLGAALVLPLGLHGAAGGGPFAVRLFVVLAASVGLPFVTLSATSPLFSRWFSLTGHEDARDPYFLYAASNVGSMLALAAYPFVIEPFAGLALQKTLFTGGYALFALLAVACALPVLRAGHGTAKTELPEDDAPIASGRRVRWAVLALVPSAGMLGVTTYVSTTVLSIPLFWVLPLAIYLASFVLTFAKKPLGSPATWARLLPLPASLSVLTLVLEANAPAAALVALHLGTFALVCLVCHGLLAADRPGPRHLTGYFFLTSLGGVAGGILAGLVAPMLVDRLVEWPLALVGACLLRPPQDEEDRGLGPRDLPAVLAMLAVGSAITWGAGHFFTGRAAFSAIVVGLGALLLVNYGTLVRPVRFGLGLGAIILAGALYTGSVGNVLLRERNAFGLLRVAVDPTGRWMQFVHGDTVHGRQLTDPARRREPSGYYHVAGPAGDVLGAAGPPRRSVGVVGLGIGDLAAYAKPGETWTFYEIDPAIARVAQDPRYFTFLADAFPDRRGLVIEVGDARLSLDRAAPGGFDILVLDAFSSDSIPAHLLTREAFALYLEKLAPSGVIFANVSNRFLDLAPLVAAVATQSGLVAQVRLDDEVGEELASAGKLPSRWMTMARSAADLAFLPQTGWREAKPGGRAWTDDRSSLLPLLVGR
jgi:hypothetical protein